MIDRGFKNNSELLWDMRATGLVKGFWGRYFGGGGLVGWLGGGFGPTSVYADPSVKDCMLYLDSVKTPGHPTMMIGSMSQ